MMNVWLLATHNSKLQPIYDHKLRIGARVNLKTTIEPYDLVHHRIWTFVSRMKDLKTTVVFNLIIAFLLMQLAAEPKPLHLELLL